jgi:hypothetical protein
MNNLTHAWANPILTGNIERIDIVDELVTHILSNYDLEFPPGEINNHNVLTDGKFKPFLEQIVDPVFDEYLQKVIGKCLTDFPNRDYRGWITGAKTGYNMLTHNHNGSQIAGVFYLYNEQVDNGGELVLFDPRSNANRSYKMNDWGDMFNPIRIKAEPNTFIVFPSFVYHQTTPYNGNLRIAVPVDLFI